MSTAATRCFSGYCWPREESNAIVIGAPLEETTSYRPGTRFAPNAIREASAFIEYWSLRANLDVEEYVKFHDAGDALVEQPLSRALEAVAAAVREYLGDKPLVILGGEHTLTYGVVQALVESGRKPCVLQLDAHMDMRDEYAGRRLSHATFMRRVMEEYGVPLLQVGVRGFAREEVEFARRAGVVSIDARSLSSQGVSRALSTLLRMLGECNHLHVTLDMDVYDPGVAPGVSNPEPEGPPASLVLDLLFEAGRIAGRREIGLSLDVVEVSPPFDCGGITSVLAVKSILEFMAGWVSARRDRA